MEKSKKPEPSYSTKLGPGPEQKRESPRKTRESSLIDELVVEIKKLGTILKKPFSTVNKSADELKKIRNQLLLEQKKIRSERKKTVLTTREDISQELSRASQELAQLGQDGDSEESEAESLPDPPVPIADQWKPREITPLAVPGGSGLQDPGTGTQSLSQSQSR